jgi:hypothetical protein
VELRALAVVALAACSGNKVKAGEDAAHPAPKPAPADAAAVAVVPGSGVGDVQVRVEWANTPQPMRAPGPPTRCGSPRTPAVRPTTTWGVPDVIVTLDAGTLAADRDRQGHIVLEGCAFTPRAVIAGSSLTIASEMREPATVTLTPDAGSARTIYLPIAGHAVDVALEPDTTYALAYGTDDVATVVTSPKAYVAVTEASGNVVLRNVPAGTQTVRAYLPARGGAQARTATAQVTVTAGALAEVTVDIGRP